jgi:3-methyladenine DNA glycosylase AlkC
MPKGDPPDIEIIATGGYLDRQSTADGGTLYDVRRLVSEGTRPRLPWGIRLNSLVRDPMPGIALLNHLKDDPSEYVRRSVANHLNDISKDHPDLVAQLAAEWMTEASVQREHLLRHACRTLIKQGHPEALGVFGYNEPRIAKPKLGLSSRKVLFGEDLQLQLVIKSNHSETQKLVIDYVVQFRKSNGNLSPKVFKWSRVELSPGERAELRKAHSFVHITTRKYYSGGHAINVRINGLDFAPEKFDLVI